MILESLISYSFLNGGKSQKYTDLVDFSLEISH